LYNGVEDNRSVFKADNIYEALGEPSMMKTKKGDIVSIVGIDVKNGGVIDIDHPNYGTGPKGKLIALIENPTNGIDVFPAWKAKSNRVFKENTKGNRPSQKAVAAQTMGTAANDKAFQGAVANTEMSDMDVLLGKLRFAFPGVSTTTTIEEFNNILSQPGTRTKISNGKIILGLTKDGKIFINPEAASLATPIHEFGHIWMDFLRSKASGDKGTALLKRGLKLVEGTKALEVAIEKYGDNKLAREEALVELMATKGNNIIDAGKKSNFKEWMNATFKYIQKKFVTSKDLDAKRIKKLSLDEFINTGLADLFKGKALDADASKKNKFDAKKKSKGSMPRLEVGSSITDFIEKRRAEGFSDKAIQLSLERQNIDAKKISDAFEEIENNKLNLQDGIQDKTGNTSGTKKGSEGIRSDNAGPTEKKPRFNVGASSRVVGNDSVVKTFTLSNKEESSLSEAIPGRVVVDTEFYEVNDPELFHKQISESTKSNKYAASVFVYSVKEYANSRLFLTPDGKAGLAITEDGDIISVFSYEDGKGRVPQLIVNAIKEGAVSLDHYDTILTNYYALFGFKPVAKVKWNDEYAPDGWDKKVFGAFNNGEPDVVAIQESRLSNDEHLNFREVLDTVKNSIATQIKQAKVKIRADFTKAPDIEYPLFHLQSILQNLLTNSIKYRQPNKEPLIKIKTLEKDGGLYLVINDNGLGMDLDSSKDNIFKLFKRMHTHVEGDGVGLYIVNSLVESHGGTIEVTSEINKGTTFKIYLGYE